METSKQWLERILQEDEALKTGAAAPEQIYGNITLELNNSKIVMVKRIHEVGYNVVKNWSRPMEAFGRCETQESFDFYSKSYLKLNTAIILEEINKN